MSADDPAPTRPESVEQLPLDERAAAFAAAHDALVARLGIAGA